MFPDAWTLTACEFASACIFMRFVSLLHMHAIYGTLKRFAKNTHRRFPVISEFLILSSTASSVSE